MSHKKKQIYTFPYRVFPGFSSPRRMPFVRVAFAVDKAEGNIPVALTLMASREEADGRPGDVFVMGYVAEEPHLILRQDLNIVKLGLPSSAVFGKPKRRSFGRTIFVVESFGGKLPKRLTLAARSNETMRAVDRKAWLIVAFMPDFAFGIKEA